MASGSSSSLTWNSVTSGSNNASLIIQGLQFDGTQKSFVSWDARKTCMASGSSSSLTWNSVTSGIARQRPKHFQLMLFLSLSDMILTLDSCKIKWRRMRKDICPCLRVPQGHQFQACLLLAMLQTIHTVRL